MNPAMPYSKSFDQTLALAGVLQSACLAAQIAKNGSVDNNAYSSLIHSLYEINAENIPDVYGGITQLKLGLNALVDQFTKNNPDLLTMKRSLALLHLEKKLKKNNYLWNFLGTGIEKIIELQNHYPKAHTNMVIRFADLYQNTASQLRPRIIITGDAAHLQNPDNVAKIRALLLAGIRSAVLWRQKGGSKWSFLFSRKAMISDAKHALAQIEDYPGSVPP